MKNNKIPTIKPTDRETFSHLKSKSELKKMGLMPHPLSKPRALVIRRMYGNYYLYDVKKTVPYKETDQEKRIRATRKSRLSCKNCGTYLGRDYKELVDLNGNCFRCQQELFDKWRNRCLSERKERYEKIRKIPGKDILVLDVETTGLYNYMDEILQVAFINGDGEELLNIYTKPTHTTEWEDAYRVNNISPEMIEDKESIDIYLDTMQNLINKAKLIVGYNVNFDIGFLEAAGVHVLDETQKFDAIIDFAEEYGEWDYKRNWYRYKSLSVAAEYYNYGFIPHDALNDIKATLFIFKNLIKADKRAE